MSATAVSDWPTPTVSTMTVSKPRRLGQQHGLARAPRHAAQGGAGRRRADERGVLARQLFHARLVAQDRAAAALGRGIDRQHGERAAALDQGEAEALDEGRLSDPGNASDAEPHRPAGVRQQAGQQRIGALAMIGPRRFDQGDGLGERTTIPAQQGGQQRIGCSVCLCRHGAHRLDAYQRNR